MIISLELVYDLSSSRKCNENTKMRINKSKFLFLLVIYLLISLFCFVYFPPPSASNPWGVGGYYALFLPPFYFVILAIAIVLFLGKKMIFISKVAMFIVILAFILQLFLIVFNYSSERCSGRSGSNHFVSWLLANKICLQTVAMPDGVQDLFLFPNTASSLPGINDSGNSPPGIPPPPGFITEKESDKLYEQYGILIPWVPSRLIALSMYFLFLIISFVLIRADKRSN